MVDLPYPVQFFCDAGLGKHGEAAARLVIFQEMVRIGYHTEGARRVRTLGSRGPPLHRQAAASLPLRFPNQTKGERATL